MVFTLEHIPQCNVLYIQTSLIPAKRKTKHVTEYIESLDAAAAKYALSARYRECTIFFVCHYTCAATRYIDNDNLSIKLITDVLQRYYFVSDNSSLVTTVCISEPSKNGFTYLKLKRQLKSNSEANKVRGWYFVPDEKESLFAQDPLAVQQVQGSTMSFALIAKNPENRLTMYCFFFLYDKNKVFNETTEKI